MVRTYKPPTRQVIRHSIRRIAEGRSPAAGRQRNRWSPSTLGAFRLQRSETDARDSGKLRTVLAPDKLVEVPPQMAFDDFAEYGLAGAREVMFSLGAVYLDKYAAAQQSGAAPLPKVANAIRAGVRPRTAAPPQTRPDRPRPART